MRLTLRTLLAYLDDTLEPAQARLIGQKVAESDTAQELIARIKQVTRRRRLTTPPTGPGSKLDPNNIAEYLDNTLPPDQLAEVEQTCLGSDIHLAEIAACHQILTLVLGEPALIPPTSKQRMYTLVKGPEAIPFRRPADAAEEEPEDASEHNSEADETLRLGLPAYRRGGSWTSRLILLGGAVAAGLLLTLAIWQALRLPQEPETDTQVQQTTEPRTAAVARKLLSPAKDTSAREKAVTPPEQPAKTEPEKSGPAKSTETKSTEPMTVPNPKTGPGTKAPPPETGPGRIPPTPMEVAVEPPSSRDREAGKLLFVAADPPSLLLERQPPNGTWRLLDERNPQVHTNRPLVSLPGFRSVVLLKSGLRLTLWGNVPEQVSPFPPALRESLVELHAHPDLDLDLTLRRGRIVLNNPEAKPLRARVRFDNPTNPKMPEVWDISLEDAGTEVLIDRWGAYTRDEPFYPDPKQPRRVGPEASLHLILMKGAIVLRRDTSTIRIEADPPKAIPVVPWNSFKGSSERALTMDRIPDWATIKPSLPAGMPQRMRDDMNAAIKSLTTSLSGRPDKVVNTVLAGDLKSEGLANAALAVRCFGALDDLPHLADALADGERREIRLIAIDTLRNWIAASRDNDYVLFDELLSKKYRKGETEIMLSLLHNFSERDALKPETYDVLIAYLDHPKVAIRELASWHLYQLAGGLGATIGYSATADTDHRRASQAAWEKLLKDGKLPPRPMGPPAGPAGPGGG